MKVTDCFGTELHEGDDILIAMNNTFHCGFIHTINNDYIEYDEQIWVNEEEITILHQEFFNYSGYKLKNIYKING